MMLRPLIRRFLRLPLETDPYHNLPQTSYIANWKESAIASMLQSVETGLTADWHDLQGRMLQGWPHFAAVSAVRTLAVERMEVTIDPASDAKADMKAADLLREQFVDSGLIQRALPHLLTAQREGFAAMEVIWQMDGRYWRPVHLRPIPHRQIGYRDGAFGLFQAGLGLPSPWAEGKVLLFRPQETANKQPVQDGFGWPMAHFWLYSDFGLKAWAEVIEKFAKPLVIGKYHRGAADDDKAVLKKAVTNLGRNAAAILPEEMLLEMVETRARPGSANMDFLRFLDRAASKLVLGQDSTTEAISGGHAVSREHNQVRLEVAQADADALAASFSEQLAHWSLQLNIAGATRPRITIQPAETTDLAEYRASLAEARAAKLPVSKTQFYELTGIRPPADADDELNPSTNPDPDNPDSTSIQGNQGGTDQGGKQRLTGDRARGVAALDDANPLAIIKEKNAIPPATNKKRDHTTQNLAQERPFAQTPHLYGDQARNRDPGRSQPILDAFGTQEADPDYPDSTSIQRGHRGVAGGSNRGHPLFELPRSKGALPSPHTTSPDAHPPAKTKEQSTDANPPRNHKAADRQRQAAAENETDSIDALAALMASYAPFGEWSDAYFAAIGGDLGAMQARLAELQLMQQPPPEPIRDGLFAAGIEGGGVEPQ